ncbi:DUF1003 domain-containing protein [Paenibacillus eucommiae]|uniref:Membrane protein n=1 Tax=Paenibacillus eucommiae TaxID=1355755 RepID=A0ABS4IQC5_9BACL|nr:DUF1003 domain-containing protein [Paenibacillus eucommiae]MBP1988814.1 putative membrane protein [Paenibacillus eucommiae]
MEENKVKTTRTDDTLIIEEMDPDKLSGEHIKRVQYMVKEYKGSIKRQLDIEDNKRITWSERLADKVASFGGSWTFIVWFAIFLGSWIIWNIVSFTFHFDPAPFILLNLILSFTAGFQAPIILMSQNRQQKKDKQDAIMDFAINFKAEQENLELQQAIHRMEEKLERLEELIVGSAGKYHKG